MGRDRNPCKLTRRQSQLEGKPAVIQRARRLPEQPESRTPETRRALRWRARTSPARRRVGSRLGVVGGRTPAATLPLARACGEGERQGLLHFLDADVAELDRRPLRLPAERPFLDLLGLPLADLDAVDLAGQLAVHADDLGRVPLPVA